MTLIRQIITHIEAYGPTSQYVLVCRLGKLRQEVARAVKEHRRRGRFPALHIASYERVGTQHYPVVAIGDKDDAPPPKRLRARRGSSSPSIPGGSDEQAIERQLNALMPLRGNPFAHLIVHATERSNQHREATR